MRSQSKFVFEAILILAVVIALAVIPRAASAEQHKMHGPPPFAEFDKDGDGFVNEEEFTTTRGEHMAARAKAGGKMRGAATAPAFADVDTDGDGKLNEAELTAAHETHHAAMRKHDGGCKGKRKGKKQASES